MRGIWTRERIALLKRLWTDGKTATAIAAQLRMSKSAVLGKVFRLRLRKAGNAAANATAARSNAKILSRLHKRRSPNKVRAKPAAAAAAAAPAIASRKTLFELTNDCCRWLGN